MTDKRAENMRRLNEDPEFTAARDRRAQERFATENARLQRLANIAKRGCDVPDWLERQWQALKQMKVRNRDAANMLGIRWLGDPDEAADTGHRLATARRVIGEQIGYIETLLARGQIDPDISYKLIEREKQLLHVLQADGGG